MGNHVHLLIETGRIPLSKILQGINQSYTIYFNRKYRTVGHLFQGRYKAILCDRDKYLLALTKYIHLNPIRANIIRSLVEYPWSSFPAYIGKAPKGIVNTDRILRMFSENRAEARRLLLDFMNDGKVMKKEEVYSTIDQRLLGDDDFVEKVINKYDGEIRKEKRKRGESLFDIANAIEEFSGVSLEGIRAMSKSRKNSTGRALLSIIASEYGYSGQEIADFIRRDPAIVTRHIKEKGNLKAEKQKVIHILDGMNKR